MTVNRRLILLLVLAVVISTPCLGEPAGKPIIGPGGENPNPNPNPNPNDEAAKCEQNPLCHYVNGNCQCTGFNPNPNPDDRAAKCEQNPLCHWVNGNCQCTGFNPKPNIGPSGRNPASVYCVEQGGKTRIEHTPQGDVGYCDLPDGTKCEEWAFYRGECKPNPKPPTPIIGVPGTEVFTFQAVGVGETDLVMNYIGPSGNVVKTEIYHIVVTS